MNKKERQAIEIFLQYLLEYGSSHSNPQCPELNLKDLVKTFLG